MTTLNIMRNVEEGSLLPFARNKWAVIFPALACLVVSFRGSAQTIVNVKPGDSVQEIVQSSPAGTTFNFKSGVYRLLEIKPRDRDSFTGDGSSAILSGAVIVKGFRKDGPWFDAPYDAPKEQLNGSCNKDSSMCKYPEDCFVDNKPLRRVSDLSELKSGAWFLDYTGRKAILADDPTGHVVEISTARSAFSGAAANVTITGLTIEKYAVPAQMGAVGDQSPGPHWTISKCIVRWNHGAGIMVSDDSAVNDNRVIQNGQLGVASHGKNISIQNNEIASNNYAGFSAGWEAGGTKFSHTTNLVVKGNNVHDNSGPGLWTDIENENATYEANRVTNNANEGIKHEISFAAKIHGNFVSGNGQAQSEWLWGSQILIQNSSGADVSENTVVAPKGYGNGIGVILQNRGKYVARDNAVHNNDITFLDAAKGYSGIACDYESEAGLIPANHFDNNHYHVTETGRKHWLWRMEEKWEEFQQKHGAETHGSVDTSPKLVK